MAFTLVSVRYGRTYQEVAEELGLSIGTVSQHLRRIRLGYPVLYTDLMKLRARQLKARHRQALANAKTHTHDWYLRNGFSRT